MRIGQFRAEDVKRFDVVHFEDWDGTTKRVMVFRTSVVGDDVNFNAHVIDTGQDFVWSTSVSNLVAVECR